MQRSRKVKAPPPGDRPLKTLDRVLSKAGLGSRRDATELIRDGRVTVNTLTVRDPDQWIDIEKDSVSVDGTPLRSATRTYWMLNKPIGYLTTYRHPHGRATVYDLLPEEIGWVFPIGRLDLETSGLLLMTNDSAFAESIMNPEYHVPKTYRVLATGSLGEEQLDRLRDGVELDDGPTRPARIERVASNPSGTSLELTITEGRNRQVRRMLESIGSGVIELERISIGPISLGDLPRGSLRPLQPEEVRSLIAVAGADVR